MDERISIKNKRLRTWVVVIAVVVLLAGIVSLPPVWSRVSYHSFAVYRAVKYWLRPPSEAVFVPSNLSNTPLVTPVSATATAVAPTAEPATQPATRSAVLPVNLPSGTAITAPPQLTPTSTPVPSLTPTPLPSYALLKGIQCERQLMNNCGPATLSMYLSFYDWGKDQIAAGGVLRPNDKDVNVMPYELVDYVNAHTEQRALWRYGGDLHTIKTLISAGIPVMIEKGFEPFSLRNEGWLGHYNLVVGYDDEHQNLTVQDSYLMSYPPWGGQIPQSMWSTFIGFDFSYKELERAWQAFNYVFIVVYQPEREGEVLQALGPLATDEAAYQIAYDRAVREASSLTDVRDQFFAWFNAGTSLVGLQDYVAAANAYDTAFSIYPDIDVGSRPYRMLWYQTGPYEAYYYSERYQDVINLATQTLGLMADPALEESYYWRALAYHALGNTTRAVADLRTSLVYHPGYAPSVTMLEQLGKSP